MPMVRPIIHFGDLEGGTASTVHLCRRHGRPHKLIGGEEASIERAVEVLTEFVAAKDIVVLNVAAPRASQGNGAYAYAYAVVEGLLRRVCDWSGSGNRCGGGRIPAP